MKRATRRAKQEVLSTLMAILFLASMPAAAEEVPDKTSGAEKTGTAEAANKADGADKSDKSDKAGGAGKANEADRADKTDKALVAIDAFIAAQDVNKKKRGWKSSLNKPPKLEFSRGSKYFWHLQTNKGRIKIKLFQDSAPMHASSTIYLTRLGFYDNIVFHRVISGFMAQGGDPTGTGSGGPGYYYAGEFDKRRKHNKAGILSMANRGPNTDGSQFFLTFTKTPHLDGNHTVFGEVVEGMATVRLLEKAGRRNGKPREKLVIEKATIGVE